MDLTIARLAPLTKAAERIADALEIIARLYREDCEYRGLVLRPAVPVKDPAQENDVTYTDEEKEWIRDLKAQYGVLSEEEKKAIREGVSPDAAKALEGEE